MRILQKLVPGVLALWILATAPDSGGRYYVLSLYDIREASNE